MNQTNTILTLVILLVFVAAFTVAIPALEAQARSSTATSNDKGQQGDDASNGKRHTSCQFPCTPNCRCP